MRHTPSAVQAQNELIRHRAEGRIQHAATIPLMDAMSWVGSNLGGLDRDEVAHSEADNGRNVVTRGKKKVACPQARGCIRQSLYGNPVFPSHYLGNDGHDIPGVVDDGQHAGGL